MTIRVNASLAFTEFSVEIKLIFGKHVGKCLATEKDSFPNVPIPLSTLLQTTDDLGEAAQNTLSGDSVAIEKRNELNELWNTQFRKTANYVSFVADGNATLIKSSGFECTKAVRQKKGKIESLDDFEATVKPAKGTAEVSCKRVEGANGYVMIAADEDAKISMSGNDILVEMGGRQVRIKTCTQSSATFTGLPSKATVGISMIAFNSAGSSPLTAVQTLTPQ